MTGWCRVPLLYMLVRSWTGAGWGNTVIPTGPVNNQRALWTSGGTPIPTGPGRLNASQNSHVGFSNASQSSLTGSPTETVTTPQADDTAIVNTTAVSRADVTAAAPTTAGAVWPTRQHTDTGNAGRSSSLLTEEHVYAIAGVSGGLVLLLGFFLTFYLLSKRGGPEDPKSRTQRVQGVGPTGHGSHLVNLQNLSTGHRSNVVTREHLSTHSDYCDIDLADDASDTRMPAYCGEGRESLHVHAHGTDCTRPLQPVNC